MKKRTMFVVLAALLILTGALLVGLFLSDSRRARAEISLPAQGGADIDPTPDIGKDNVGRVSEITVGPTNVRRVVASLTRPAQYSYTARAQYVYDGGSAALETRGWVRPGLCLTRQYDAEGALRTQSVLTENNVYVWGADGGAFYRGAPGDFTADDMGRLPTYESIAALPAEQILGADVREDGDASCVYVRSGTETAYTEWYISLDNGLLLRAATTEDGVEVWSLNLTALTVGEIEDGVFLLPNGTMPE